jgi:hypothetical protein
MAYTLAEAAKATGMNKELIFRAIKSGKLPGRKDDQGAWTVEPAELHRLYPAVAAQNDGTSTLAEWRARARLAEQQLAAAQAALEDMRAQRDKWAAVAERLSTPAEPTKRWWKPKLLRKKTAGAK